VILNQLIDTDNPGFFFATQRDLCIYWIGFVEMRNLHGSI